MHVDAGWSSLVARRAHNPKVVGSNPAPATKFLKEAHNKVGLFAQWTLVFCAIIGAITPFFIGYRVVSTFFGQIVMFHYYNSFCCKVVVEWSLNNTNLTRVNEAIK